MKFILYLKNNTCNFKCNWKKNYLGQQNTDNGMEPFQKKNSAFRNRTDIRLIKENCVQCHAVSSIRQLSAYASILTLSYNQPERTSIHMRKNSWITRDRQNWYIDANITKQTACWYSNISK